MVGGNRKGRSEGAKNMHAECKARAAAKDKATAEEQHRWAGGTSSRQLYTNDILLASCTRRN